MTGPTQPELMSSVVETLVHGTAVALCDRAALIRGASGAGKSDLALRFLMASFAMFPALPERRLVADDQVLLRRQGPPDDVRLVVDCPPAIAGKIEVRGVGIVDVPYRRSARLCVVVDLVHPDTIERMPESTFVSLLGCVVPAARIAAFDPSAINKLLFSIMKNRDSS